jgi:hypothetical protein
MKIKLLSLFTFFLIFNASEGHSQSVEKFTIDNNTYYGTKAIPDEITGLYKYEKTKEPIVDIRKDGTGFFQVHDVKAYPVEFWIETDELGNIQKQKSTVNSNYKVVLIVKYGSNGESGWRGANAGTYTRIDVGMAFDLGYAIVLGERFRKL